MKKFINPKKSNYYNDVLTSFSEDSKLMFIGMAKSFATNKYKWIGDFLFKHRTNFSTNPHMAFLSFFNDREIVYQEYGNIPEIYNYYTFLQEYNRQKFSPVTYELSSPQYDRIAQKNTNFDLVEFINVSGRLPIIPNSLEIISLVGEVNINHEYKNNPIFHVEGYRKKVADNRKFIWVNKNQNLGTALTNNFNINIGEEKSDIVGATQDGEVNPNDCQRFFDYKIQVDHKNFFYFTNSSEWIVYHTRTESFHGNDKKFYFGAVMCYNSNDKEIKPYNIQHFPDVLVDGKVEMAKTVITWKNEYLEPLEVSGKCSFYPGNVSNINNDQSRLVFNICKYMFDGSMSINRELQISNGINLYVERNRRHYATVMTEPYFTTKAINNGIVVSYQFINKDGLSIVNSGSLSSSGIYLKIKCNIDTIKEIDRLFSVKDYNTDIIDTLIIKNPRSVGSLLNENWEYTNFLRNFYTRQDLGVFDRYVEGYADNVFRIDIDNSYKNSVLYSDYMAIAGMGYYSETKNIAGIISEDEYLTVYCTNYKPNGGIAQHLLVSNDAITKIVDNEQFKPLLKLNGINGYIKILNKNKDFKIVQSYDNQYEVVYNVEFPYCPGSYSTRCFMDFSEGYKTTQILYKDSYISAGSQACYGLDKVYDDINDRHIILNDEAFTYAEFAGSKDDEKTYWFKDGGGIVEEVKKSKSTITYPGNRVLTNITPDMISCIVGDDVGNNTDAKTYQINLLENNFDSYQLLLLSDNKRWAYDNKSKFEPYINRENPSYVLEMNVSALFNDYIKNQKNHDFLPDMKRWLYSYMKGFAYTYNISNDDINSLESTSDMSIEIWDNLSLIGANRSGNWRSITPNRMDENKIKGKLIIDKLKRIGEVEPVIDGYGTFTLKWIEDISAYDIQQIKDMCDSNSLSNKILYDSSVNRLYHIAYAEFVDENIGIHVTLKWDEIVDIIPSSDDAGLLQILEPVNFISKYKNFEFFSSKLIHSGDGEAIQSFIDIRKDDVIIDNISTTTTTPAPEDIVIYDLKRYVDENNKIYFRIRVNRGKNWHYMKIDKDNDGFIYWDKDNLAAENNPWKTDSTFDVGFNWNKVSLSEKVSKLGLTYFKLGSI